MERYFTIQMQSNPDPCEHDQHSFCMDGGTGDIPEESGAAETYHDCPMYIKIIETAKKSHAAGVAERGGYSRLAVDYDVVYDLESMDEVVWVLVD